MEVLNTNITGSTVAGLNILTQAPDMSTYKKFDDNDHPKFGNKPNPNANWARCRQLGTPDVFPNFFSFSQKDIPNIYQSYPYTIDRIYRGQLLTGTRINWTVNECWTKSDADVPGYVPVALPATATVTLDISNDPIVTSEVVQAWLLRVLGKVFYDVNVDVISNLRAGFTNPVDVLPPKSNS